MAYNNRGNAYSDKGDYDRAIADYTQAIRLAPNVASRYYNRGLAYYSKKDYDRAIVDFNQAIRLDPNNANAKEWLEYVRQLRGR
jgi:tetratricopeptide (TPR) repeat protein